jgi:purine-binding chemotaxis protein CheW
MTPAVTCREVASAPRVEQLVTFRVEDLALGIDVLRVQEVIRFQDMTPVPLAPPVIRGLINLRGQIVTAVDLRHRLGVPPLEAGRQPMNVVVRTADRVVSLLVDDIGDVLEIDERQRENVPETLQPPVREMASGIVKLPGQLLVVLDVDRTLGLRGLRSPTVV